MVDADRDGSNAGEPAVSDGESPFLTCSVQRFTQWIRDLLGGLRIRIRIPRPGTATCSK